MTQARETLTIMDSNQPNGTFPSKRRRGIFLSKNLILIILVIFALALICTSFIVYNFAACPRTDQLANVTKFELHTCDSHKLSVLPLATAVPKPAVTIEFSPQMSTSTISSTTESKEDALRVTDVRLPKTMYPEKYILKLTPYIFEGNFTFEGEVSINLHVTNETNKIVFHAVDLYFQHLVVYQEHIDGSYIIINKLKRSEDASRQYHILELAENLRADEKYKMNVTYQGYLNDNLHGFYRSSYFEKNITRWIAVTQFQPTDARRAFPCFDEPAMKARFTISIARPRHLSSLSNMNAVGHPTRHETLEDYVWDHYAESLPMSTYLVAFAVTDFGHLSDQNFAVWARHEALQSASYALEIGPKILNFFEQFYKIEFPLPKIDMIALPDFNSGAMENWGLLTFRETAMLYQSGISPRTTQPRVAAVVAHEIAHQWFGNLVTPAWWSDIWLNEGFASYLEYVAVDAIEPSWNIMEIFVLNEVQSVFRLDAMESSHQISIEVGNPEEIKDIFDMISYRKGSAILRMMNHFLKSEEFNEGITNYLNEKTYGSAEQDDLWRALTEVARKNDPEAADVAVVMDSWTLQTGFPVLTVTRDYGSDTITFDQERFLLVNNTQEKNPMWWIPISYTTDSEKNFNKTHPRLWLRGNKSVTVSDIVVKPEDWLIVNIQLTGFYRVNYDKENWDLIIEVLSDPSRFQDIHPINRAQIIDDAMNLALAGRLSYHTAMDVTKYLAHEKSYVPWKAGLLALGYIDTMFAKGSYYLEYKRHIAHLLSGVMEELGWEMVANESVIRTQHRADMLSTACHLEIEGCLSHAVRLFTNWMLTPNPDLYNEISADVRSTVYCVGVQAGGSREWSFTWDRFRAATVPSERELLISVLGCTRAPYLLYRYLELSLRNDSGIRKQDTVRVFSAVSSSTVGQSIAFNFVRSNWNRLKEYFGSYSALNLILKAVTWRMNQKYELEEVRKFAEEHCAELGNRSILQVLERTASNVQWMDRNYQTIVNWLLAAEAKSTES